ncbi:MAG TPA: hypothetical protein P5275_03260 [Saprospiraceae bacterium]|nr:hypothetical protein [Saprospiraceae bacterium]
MRRINYATLIIATLVFIQCSHKKPFYMDPGYFGYDQAHLKEHVKDLVLLTSPDSNQQLLVSPSLQSRVFTSSADGRRGRSFGWVNYTLLERGEVSPQFNPYGGEDRFWLGPEGGPFALYFAAGQPQTFDNWVVPGPFDRDPFKVIEQDPTFIHCRSEFTVTNYAGTPLSVQVDRTVRLLDQEGVEHALNMELPVGVRWVGYSSENGVQNTGEAAWTAEQGQPSVWILDMFPPAENGAVIIPFRAGDESEFGMVVRTNYFGDIPADRLQVNDDYLLFKVDGHYRSKIGIPPLRARQVAGSYDPDHQTLTIIQIGPVDTQSVYVNSVWGTDTDPYDGDVINSYNDGPLDGGGQLGPFFEIESSSPALALEPGASYQHLQRTFHFTGDAGALNQIMQTVLGVAVLDVEHFIHPPIQ